MIRLNVVLLPAPFGPISPTMRPLSTSKRDVVHGDQAAECLACGLQLQQPRPRRGQRPVQRILVTARRRRVRRGRGPEQDWPNAVGGGLQDQYQDRAERDGFEIAGVAGQPWQHVLQLVAQNRDAGGAENGAVDATGAAQHRHQQIFGAGRDTEGAGRNRALEMRVEPSGQPRQHRRIDEHHQLGGGGIDAEGFGGAGAAPKRADRADRRGRRAGFVSRSPQARRRPRPPRNTGADRSAHGCRS